MKRADALIDWIRVKEELLRKERLPADGTINSAAKRCLAQAKDLVKVRTSSTENIISGYGDSSVILGTGHRLKSRTLSSYLKGADSVHIFVVTIGDGIERAASRLMKNGESLEGYILDRIGSFAAESAAEKLEGQLRASYAARNMSVSRRMSPGYCDWPVEEQLKLQDILDFSRAGVRLTENCMMVPKKSISAILGIGSKGLFNDAGSRCGRCNKKSCGYRSSA
jgi:hypothetical protein